MAVRYQRAVDLVELTGILQTTGAGLSIDEIADRFGVSRRTAERMLSALRLRFPDLAPVFRGGRKYWRLPTGGRTQAIQLPRTLEVLNERIAELEAEIAESRDEDELIRGFSEGVLATSSTGLVVLDANLSIVWSNDAFVNTLALQHEDLADRDMRALVRDRLRNVLADPEPFVEKVLASYEDGTYIARLECRMTPQAGRPERLLLHGSRPILTGRYAGNRVDFYLDLGERATSAEPDSVPDRELGRGDRPEDIERILRDHCELLSSASADALASTKISPARARRFASILHANVQAVEATIEVMRSGGIKFERMNPASALEMAAAIVRPHAEERGVRVIVDAEGSLPAMIGDRALTIFNLAAGARMVVDALEASNTIALRAELLANPSRIRVSLEDDGASRPDDFSGIHGEFFETQNGAIGIGVTLARDDEGRPTGGISQYFEIPADRDHSEKNQGQKNQR